MENLHELRQIFLQILNEEQDPATDERGNLEDIGSRKHMKDFLDTVEKHANARAVGEAGHIGDVVTLGARLGLSHGEIKKHIAKAHINGSRNTELPKELVAGHRRIVGSPRMQTASTDYSRLMLRSLFEALMEAEMLESKPIPVTPGMRTDLSRPNIEPKEVKCPDCGKVAKSQPPKRRFKDKSELPDGRYWCPECNEPVED